MCIEQWHDRDPLSLKAVCVNAAIPSWLWQIETRIGAHTWTVMYVRYVTCFCVSGSLVSCCRNQHTTLLQAPNLILYPEPPNLKWEIIGCKKNQKGCSGRWVLVWESWRWLTFNARNKTGITSGSYFTKHHTWKQMYHANQHHCDLGVMFYLTSVFSFIRQLGKHETWLRLRISWHLNEVMEEKTGSNERST